MPIEERMKLAEGKPLKLRLMAATAQQDCGSCGYLCGTYAEAIATGADNDLTKCVPGGKETAKMFKEILKETPLPSTNGVAVSSAPAVTAMPSPVANGAAVAPAMAPTPKAPPPSLLSSVYDRRNPYPARILSVTPLSKPGSQKNVCLVKLDLGGSGLTYEVGDSLGVYAENDPHLVVKILRLLGASGEEPVVTPEGWIVPARIALANAYVINQCNEETLSLLGHNAADAGEADRLHALAAGEDDAYLEGQDVLGLLEAFPSARADVRELIPTLSSLRPRLYSISSSMKQHPTEVHLTVAAVQYEKGGCGRMRKGVASTFLSERTQPGHKVGIFVQPSHGFHLPADGDTPVVMIGPGTGIAPFRAFLQERQAAGAAGKNWVFFGDQRRDFDYLYEEELEAYRESGLLTRLDLAFSRDQAEKVYVQHRMLENAPELWRWLSEGAHVYVCGDASRMARDVDDALRRIAAEQGGMSELEAKAYVAGLAKDKRYQRDVY
jgi:sulfite reductase (NADPH) flavoprotein alpha-component